MTSYISITSTDTASYASATDVSTAYTTIITVVTRSDIDIATQIRTVTVTAGKDERKRRAPTADAPATSISTRPPQPSASSCQLGQNHVPDTPRTARDSKMHARLFNFKRQVSTITNTVVHTSTIVQSTVIHITQTIYYTALRTTTFTVTSTYTSAVNAKSTVTSVTTFTSTIGPASAMGASTIGTSLIVGQSGQGGSTIVPQTTGNNVAVTNSPDVGGGSSSGGGNTLSTGAKAGIAVGTGGGSLVICLILGFIFRRRREKRKAEMAELVNNAVMAARNDALSPSPGHPADAKPAVFANSGTAPSPAPPSTPGMYAPIPVQMRDSTGTNNGWDGSTAGYSPSPRYPSPTSHEMSATPLPMPTQYQMQQQYYPPPPGADAPSGEYEMYHQHPELPGHGWHEPEMPGR